MPDAVTHALFATDLQKELQFDLVKEENNWFILGSQGPDPYFYHNFLPWKDSSTGSKIGNLLHHKQTKKVLDYLVLHAKTKEAKAFTLGMLTHYALDTNCHPYIFYVTGLYDPVTKKNRGTHLELERSIDTIFIEKLVKDYRKFSIQKTFFPKLVLPESIVELLDQAIEDTYDIKGAGLLYQEAVNDFRQSFRYITYDPLGWKKSLLKLADRWMDSSMKYQYVSNYKIRKDNVDYLNLNKKEWHHPVTNTPSNETFYDLIDRGKAFGMKLMQDAVEFFDTGDKQIFQTIQNISYDTGLEIGHGPMIYFDEIL